MGIARLWKNEALSEPVRSYLAAVEVLNSNDELRYYPGSPRIAKAHLRPQDRMVLTELHPSDHPLLEQEFHRDRQVKIFKEDGFQRLKASLPPKERRGLVLIDPPYELAKEYRDVVQAIYQSYKRWATGIYAIWYPVVNRCDIDDMLDGLKALGVRNILQIELGVSADTNERGMTASGMIVINPPWKLEQQMKTILPLLKQTIAPASGHYTLDWVVPE